MTDEDLVLEKLLEDPDDVVACDKNGDFDREFMAEALSVHILKVIDEIKSFRVLLPFTTKDGVRFAPRDTRTSGTLRLLCRSNEHDA